MNLSIASQNPIVSAPVQFGSIIPKSSNSLNIGKYNLKECIGRGNFGDVYQATHIASNKTVAIKAINIDLSEDEIPVLLQEINLLRLLNHPNITNWFETFTIDVTMFIVMEYCGEGSCTDLLRSHRKGLDDLALAYITKGVVNGLVYLHSLGIIHRDIKAANILITDDGIIKLADFGVSGEMIGTSGKKTFVGTPYWMAPEIITDKKYLKNHDIGNKNKKTSVYRFWRKKNESSSDNGDNNNNNDEDDEDDIEYDEKVDIWSLGITIIELATGKVPNSDKDPMKALFDIPKKKPPKLPESSSFYLKEFDNACLCKFPEYRPSATELLKFKFLTKLKWKTNPILPYLNKEGKIKKRKPKFDLNINIPHYGPDIQWDLESNVDENKHAKGVYKEENARTVKKIGYDENNIDNDDDEDDDDDEEDDISKKFTRETPTTSPLAIANATNIPPSYGVGCFNDGYHRELTIDSDKIKKIVKELTDELNDRDGDHDGTLECIEILEKVLLGIKRENKTVVERFFNKVNEVYR